MHHVEIKQLETLNVLLIKSCVTSTLHSYGARRLCSLSWASDLCIVLFTFSCMKPKPEEKRQTSEAAAASPKNVFLHKCWRVFFFFFFYSSNFFFGWFCGGKDSAGRNDFWFGFWPKIGFLLFSFEVQTQPVVKPERS